MQEGEKVDEWLAEVELRGEKDWNASERGRIGSTHLCLPASTLRALALHTASRNRQSITSTTPPLLLHSRPTAQKAAQTRLSPLNRADHTQPKTKIHQPAFFLPSFLYHRSEPFRCLIPDELALDSPYNMHKLPTTVAPPEKQIIAGQEPPDAERMEPAMVEPANWPAKGRKAERVSARKSKEDEKRETRYERTRRVHKHSKSGQGGQVVHAKQLSSHNR